MDKQAKFEDIWKDLPEDIQRKVKIKARWEHITLLAAIEEWWPELLKGNGDE